MKGTGGQGAEGGRPGKRRGRGRRLLDRSLLRYQFRRGGGRGVGNPGVVAGVAEKAESLRYYGFNAGTSGNIYDHARQFSKQRRFDRSSHSNVAPGRRARYRHGRSG